MAEEDNKKVDTVVSILPTVTDASGDDPWKDVRKEITQRFELLPKEIQDIVTGGDFQTHLFEISKAQGLTYEEMGILEVETTMVLLGMVNPYDYADELQDQLKKSDAEIDSLVAAVNDLVFAPVQESISKVYAAHKEPEDYLEDVPSVNTNQPTPNVNGFAVPTNIQAPATVPTAKPTPFLSATDKSVLEKSGVVISDTPVAVAPAPTAPLPSRGDLMKNIENPPRTPTSTPTPNIVAAKLASTGPTMSPTKTTDYSIVKPSGAATSVPPAKVGADPYREPLD